MSPLTRDTRHLSRFTKTIAVVVIIGLLLLIGLVALALSRARDDCQRTVAAREDNRAMWDWAIAQNPDNPKVPQFRSVLNRRLPHLRCDVRNDPVPIDSSER